MSTRRTNPLLAIDLGGAAGSLAVIVLIALLGVQPLTTIRAERDARVLRAAEIKAQTDTVLGEIRTARAAIDETAQQIESRELRLLSAGELNARIASMIEHTSERGLEVLAIKPGELVRGDLHGRVPIETALSGPLPEVVRYLHELRTRSRDLIVRRIEIRPAPEPGHVVAGLGTDWLTRAD
jgi:Tfp pilus assembly protein PilO